MRDQVHPRGVSRRSGTAAATYRRCVDWAALGVIIPTALALLALGLQWRDRRHAARASAKADQRADRTEAIAERAAVAAERQAAALEREDVTNAAAAANPRVAWTLAATGGGTYMLTNAGAATAWQVEVDIGYSKSLWTARALGMAPMLSRESMNPGEQIGFSTTFGPVYDVKVTWSAEPYGGDRRTWNRPLPPQPQSPA